MTWSARLVPRLTICLGFYARRLAEVLDDARAAAENLERLRRQGRAPDPAATRWERLH